jgi:hypothetical protein
MASVFTVTSLSLLMAEVRAESNCVEQSAVLFKSSRSLCGVETFSLHWSREMLCVLSSQLLSCFIERIRAHTAVRICCIICCSKTDSNREGRRETRPYQLVLSLLHGGSDVNHEVELLLMRSFGRGVEEAGGEDGRM